tara:strand:- start:42158 stop:42406 length:249 start_codon:yes stop_codon:yes gene_type:complete
LTLVLLQLKSIMKRINGVLLFLVLLLLPRISEAQCAMCRAVLESSDNVGAAEGINNGIVYLMAVPYILVAVLFYFVYKKMRT